MRETATALLAALALAVAAGCGDDEDRPGEENGAGGPPSSSPAPPGGAETPPPAGTEPEVAPEPEDPDGAPGRDVAPGVSPEDQPGGAGDEIPARSQARLTGRGGEITPRTVRVPPFIAIRVELRSADGATYSLTARGRTLTAGGQIASKSTTFAGLRPGRQIVLRGPNGRVVIEASAEPGP